MNATHRVQHPHIGSIAGFGTGNYLCREIVEMHGGVIRVESGEGKGTTFTIELPFGN
ncbi:ATP-binding protein [Pedobacter psychrodurus]|uniref:ATP-binding protein n=1 Tax=Pedobacter psychrodurus TaxID=2530456 RepID=UPI003977832A